MTSNSDVVPDLSNDWKLTYQTDSIVPLSPHSQYNAQR
jgi:hypothetical protein